MIPNAFRRIALAQGCLPETVNHDATEKPAPTQASPAGPAVQASEGTGKQEWKVWA